MIICALCPKEFKDIVSLLKHKHPKATRLTKLRYGVLLVEN